MPKRPPKIVERKLGREGITPKSAHARLNGNAALESGMCRVPGARSPVRCWWVKGTRK